MGGRGGGAENVKKYAENATIIKSEGRSFIFKQSCIRKDKNLRNPWVELSRNFSYD